MLKGSFDKITIRMITEQAGVIRPTFYNYFQDKYEVMEWLLDEEVFRPVFAMLEDGMEREAIYLLFRRDGERPAVLSESVRGDRTERIRGDPVRQDPAAD